MILSSLVKVLEWIWCAFLRVQISPITTSRALTTAKRVRSSVRPAGLSTLRPFNCRIATAAADADAKNVATLRLCSPVVFSAPRDSENLPTVPKHFSKMGCKTCQPPIMTPQNAGKRWSSEDFLKISIIFGRVDGGAEKKKIAVSKDALKRV